MSAAHHPPGRPPSQAGGDIEVSNSTASKFLGTMCKPWMMRGTSIRTWTGSRSCLPSSRGTSTPHSTRLSSPEYDPVTANTARSDRTATPALPLPSQSPTTSSSVRRGRPRGRPFRPVVPHTTEPSVVPLVSHAPVSRITPKTESPDSHPLSLHRTAIPASDGAPDGHHGSILPSPEPSHGSHTSPDAAVEVASDTDPAVIGPVPIREGVVAGECVGALHIASASPPPPSMETSTPATQHQPPAAGSSQYPAETTQAASLPPSLAGQSRPEKTSRDLVPLSAVWNQAQELMRLLMSDFNDQHSLSETVELPRVRLLQDACLCQDLFYLALHQTYCLSSFAPSQLPSLSKFGIQSGAGLDVIKLLLVDNQRLSGDFLKWCVHYPRPLSSMLEVKTYQAVLRQVGGFLSLVAVNWLPFEQQLQARRYPPLVDELVLSFGATSPVLQTIIFTALTRHLFGTQQDQLIISCTKLFKQDQYHYARRVEQRQYSPETLQKHSAIMTGKYQELVKLHGMAAQMSPPTRPVTEPTRRHSGQWPLNHANASTPRGPGIVQQRQTSSASPIYPSRPPSNPNMAPSINMPSSAPSYRGRAPVRQSSHHFSAVQLAQLAQMTPSNPSSYAATNPGPPLGASSPHTRPGGHQVRPTHNTAPPVHPARPLTQASIRPPGSAEPLVPNYSSNGTQNPGPHAIAQYRQQYLHGSAGSTVPQRMMQGHHMTHAPHSAPHSAPSLMPATAPSTWPSQLVSANESCSPLAPPTPLLPRSAEAVPPNRPAKPSMTALHQQDLRPLPVKLAQSTTDRRPATDLIQYLGVFAIEPTPLSPPRSVFQWNCTLSPEFLSRRPRVDMEDGTRYQVLSDGDVSYRLRCIRYKEPSDLHDFSFWFRSKSMWPQVFYLHVNQKELHAQRAFHFGKDLPVDITSYLQEGSNDIRLNILQTSQERDQNILYAIAVEVLFVKNRANIKSTLHILPSGNTRDRIQKRLSMHDDDDDMMIVDNYITIDLRDPFTTQVFNTPVRGSSCTHWECFDLDTFLQTVALNPETAGVRAPYFKCPICQKNAQPDALLIDGFLSEVRVALAHQQKLDSARAIRVRADGSWEAVLEVDTKQSDGNGGTGRVVPSRRDRGSFHSDLPEGPNRERSRAVCLGPVSGVSKVVELD